MFAFLFTISMTIPHMFFFKTVVVVVVVVELQPECEASFRSSNVETLSSWRWHQHKLRHELFKSLNAIYVSNCWPPTPPTVGGKKVSKAYQTFLNHKVKLALKASRRTLCSELHK